MSSGSRLPTKSRSSQAETLLAADFFETVTLTGTRMYVLAVIENATRRIRTPGAPAHPTAARVTQAARNLAIDMQDAERRARLLIRDRDGKYPALFDAILADTGIEVVLSGVRMPRMNSIMDYARMPKRTTRSRRWFRMVREHYAQPARRRRFAH